MVITIFLKKCRENGLKSVMEQSDTQILYTTQVLDHMIKRLGIEEEIPLLPNKYA